MLRNPPRPHRSASLQHASPALWTSLRYFSITRLVVAAIILGTAIVGDERSTFSEMLPELFRRTSLSYFILAGTLAYLAANRQYFFYPQLGVQLLLDLVALTTLIYASGGSRAGLGVVYLLPIAGAAILTPALWAMGFAACCTIAILGEAIVRQLFEPGVVSFFEAGLYGVACFAMAFVMNRLAARLLTQERIAEQRGASLQSQLEINRLVVADMQDGVLILSEEGEPRAFNPAAMRLLFIENDYPFVRDGWGNHAAGIAIRNHFWEWYAEPNLASDTLDLVVANDNPDRGGPYEHRIRARFFMHVRRITGGDHVVMLEDQRRLEERAQQLKLASMGRLTASIAHEVRNPLSAISHAAALLAEEVEARPQQTSETGPAKASGTELRLLRIVQDNTRRLDRIVQDILQLSRRAASELDIIILHEYLHQVVMEFCRDESVPPETVRVSVESDHMVRFNSDQLRQVLVNLLQNACRYSSGRPGSVAVTAASSGRFRTSGQEPSHASIVKIERIELTIQDDGPGITADVHKQLYEPFFTTRPQGTGLGLYLARELCEANGASLNYVGSADDPNRGSFIINAAAALYRL